MKYAAAGYDLYNGLAPHSQQQPSTFLLLQFLSGSPAYDSVRSLTFHDASVFLVCFNVSDPISLYNVKNKWIGEIRRHRSEESPPPIVLCGCQVDLRTNPQTVSHLAKTGRAPVTAEQALAICCDIGAVNYVETSAAAPIRDNMEALEVCAVAAMNRSNTTKSNNTNFRRSPSIQSSLSLFDANHPSLNLNNINNGNIRGSSVHHHHHHAVSNHGFKRSPSTNSNLSLAANFKMPGTTAIRRTATGSSVTSLKSPTEAAITSPDDEVRSLRTFSPEPISSSVRIPPAISENEAYQQQQQPLRSFSPVVAPQRPPLQRPNSLHEPLSDVDGLCVDKPFNSRPSRPTSLFKSGVGRRQMMCPTRQQFPVVARGAAAVLSPTSSCVSESAITTTHQSPFGFAAGCFVDSPVSEISSVATGTPMSCSSSGFVIRSPQMEVVSPTNAQVCPNGLSRRTTYRTHPKMAIPVPAPMSPVSSEDFKSTVAAAASIRSDCQSPAASTASSSYLVRSPPLLFDLKQTESAQQPQQHPGKIYESLKSQFSTSSQASGSCSEDGDSKMLPSDFSDASSVAAPTSYDTKTLNTSASAMNDDSKGVLHHHLLADITEDPQVLNSLNFVSPKVGVYRHRTKPKHSCAVM